MQQSTPSRALLVSLWLVQALLAACLIWAASMKLFQSPGKLAAMWPWTGQVPQALVKGTGIIDFAGGLGIILPSLLRIKPMLVPITGICIIILMVCASAFHISRGEASVIGANVCFALMAAFVAWGRYKKAPITPRGHL
jgi:hypothetical protein